MNVNGRHYRTIWVEKPGVVRIIDQRALPFHFQTHDLRTAEEAREAIADMYVRGAGLIGATAAFGMYLAAWNGTPLEAAAAALKAARPTASNLAWAVDRMLAAVANTRSPGEAALREALSIAEEDASSCKSIGEHGLVLIREIAERKGGEPVNVLTHCNAGWLAFVDWGTALSPVYAASDAGLPVHVWVDETRPRNQGASLTAWELGKHGVKHDLICDNTGGHLMQHGLVDLVITGADRVTRQGDAANKIGTYLKALAARDNGVPFYVALSSSTFDFSMRDGIKEIPIEERDAAEVRFVSGKRPDGTVEAVQVCPDQTPARNWAFDVTPARLITGLITERGLCAANQDAISALFPEASPC